MTLRETVAELILQCAKCDRTDLGHIAFALHWADKILAAETAHLDAAGYAVVPKEPYARVRIGAVKLESL